MSTASNIALVIAITGAILIVLGALTTSSYVYADSANSIFSNIQNFSVSGNNNSFIINSDHNTPNVTGTNTNSSIFPKVPGIISFDPAHHQVTLANGTRVAISQLTSQEQKQVLAANSNTSKSNSTNTNSNITKDTSREDSSAATNSSSIRLPNADSNKTNAFEPAPANPLGGIQKVAAYDKEKNCATNLSLRPTISQYLTYFNCGHVTVFPNGTTLREFSLIVEENHILPITLPPNEIKFPAWTFNGTIPGPTMRMTEGDHVRVTLINKGTISHTLHMHSIHPGSMDGVPYASGESGNVLPGHSFTYDFIAAPYGVYPYHCHADPLQAHINHGLYGVMIIDPKVHRPLAHEMVMLLNGYDLNLHDAFPRLPTADEANKLMNAEGDDNKNETATAGNMSAGMGMDNHMNMNMDVNAASMRMGIVPSVQDRPDDNATTGKDIPAVDLPEEHDNAVYTVNGIAMYYYQNPIQLKVNEPQRIYLVNMLDFEENSFHLHGNLFGYIASGIGMKPQFYNDMITLGQGDRGILEITYHYPGLYMAHAHFDQIASRGWMSLLEVK